MVQQLIVRKLQTLVATAALTLSCAHAGTQPKSVDPADAFIAYLEANESTLTQETIDAELGRAAFRYDSKAINWLLKKGGNPDVSNEYGETALMNAIEGAGKGADPKYGRYSPNDERFSSKEVKQRITRERDGVKLVARHSRDIEVRDKQGRTALLLAAERERFDFVAMIHAAGADINARNSYGETALFFCTTKEYFGARERRSRRQRERQSRPIGPASRDAVSLRSRPSRVC